MGGFGYNVLSLLDISIAFGRSVPSCVLTLMDTGFTTTFFMLTFLVVLVFSPGIWDALGMYSNVVGTSFVEEIPRLPSFSLELGVGLDFRLNPTDPPRCLPTAGLLKNSL